MRLLAVEDERKTATHLASHADNDLIILEVMLPKRHGWSVMAELRRAGKQIPVLFLTARDAIQDRVQGLEMGANDYLIKPFAFSELPARVRTILRRGPARQPERLRVADLEIDPVPHKATRGGLCPRRASLNRPVGAWRRACRPGTPAPPSCCCWWPRAFSTGRWCAISTTRTISTSPKKSTC